MRRILPSKITRIEGDFPTMIRTTRKSEPVAAIIELDSVEPAARIERMRELKPHEFKNPEKPRTRQVIPEISLAPEIPELKFPKKSLRDIENPFLPKKNEDTDFYRKFFSDRLRLTDGMSKEEISRSVVTEEEPVVKKRFLTTTRKYWEVPEYSTPTTEEISSMTNANDFVFAMMNEVFKNRKNKNTITSSVWEAFASKAVNFTEISRDSPRLALRTLQCLASVQLCFPRHIHGIISSLVPKFDVLQPREFFFILQALSRLRFRDERILEILQRCALCWPTLIPKHLVKAANAVAKLDAASSQWAQPLALAFRHALGTGRLDKYLTTIRAVTVLELGDDMSVIDYLVLAERQSSNFQVHANQLLWVELYARLVKPVDVWEKIPENVKEFLARRRSENKAYTEDGEEISRSQIMFSEVREILTGSGMSFFKDQKCGPFVLDFFLPKKNLVLEICPPYQFYVRTQSITANARWRHSLIRAMGFELVLIPQHAWDSLETASAKAEYLMKQIPSH